MKLIVKTDNEIKKLKPRDIRNLIGSIVEEQYKDLVLWHKHEPSELIYAKPYKLGFEIVSWKNNIKLLKHIEEKLQNKKLHFGEIEAKVKKVWYKDENLTIPQQGLFFYYTRTPIILSTNPVEYKIVYATNQKEDKNDLIKYIKHRIKYDVVYKLKHYYGIDVSNSLKDLNLIIQKEDIKLVDYKEGEKKLQAAFLKFASNYSLPRFIGYKTGLGWGELVNLKI